MAITYAYNTDDARKRLEEIEAQKPGEYQSKYGVQIGDLLNRITNRQPFSYDFNADPLYQQYKDQYTKMGNEAAMNAVGAASALTGGYGNSYAATAGAQANQQYLTQLNGIIPELYEAAMSKYQMEGNDLYNQYNLYKGQDDSDYGRYRDTFGDWQSDRDFYNGNYWNSIGNDQWQMQFDENKRQFDEQMAFEKQKYADSLARRSSGSGGSGSKKKSDDTSIYDEIASKVAKMDGKYVREYLNLQAVNGTITKKQADEIYNKWADAKMGK